MTAEKFIAAWIKSAILTPKRLTFKPINLYYQDLKNIESRKRKRKRKNKRRRIRKVLKTLNRLFKQDKDTFLYHEVYKTPYLLKQYGKMEFFIGKNKYSKCYKFSDINYAVASRDDKEEMFLEYSQLLNSFDTGATTKITIMNRRLNKVDFEGTMLLNMQNNELDKYRKEYNKMLLDKATASNGIIQEKFVTISVDKKSVEEARNYFARVGADLINHFKELGSICIELNAVERLRIFNDFYRVGEETSFDFDMITNMRKR